MPGNDADNFASWIDAATEADRRRRAMAAMSAVAPEWGDIDSQHDIAHVNARVNADGTLTFEPATVTTEAAVTPVADVPLTTVADVPRCADCSRTHAASGRALNLEPILRRDGALVCRRCIARNYEGCSMCGHLAPDDSLRWVNGEGEVCRPCIEASFSTCTECDEFYRTSAGQCCTPWDSDNDDDNDDDDNVSSFPMMTPVDVHYFPGCGCCCQSCCDGRLPQTRWQPGRIAPPPPRPRAINNYSYMPELRFRGTGPAYLGVEIELVTDYPNGDARRAVDLLGSDLVYCKEDGSISQGFELVTHPMDYAWAMSEFPWNAWDEFTSVRMGTDSSTGMHVHVSRAGFSTPCHDYRWLLFWHRNAEWIQRIARRRGSSYASFSPGERKLIAKVAKRQLPRCGTCHYCTSPDYRDSRYCEMQLRRYAAINLTNEHTYECRVFASSIKQTEIKAALGLVAGTVEYTRGLRAHDVLRKSGWSWDAFVTWLADQGDTYEPLLSEIARLTPRARKATGTRRTDEGNVF